MSVYVYESDAKFMCTRKCAQMLCSDDMYTCINMNTYIYICIYIYVHM